MPLPSIVSKCGARLPWTRTPGGGMSRTGPKANLPTHFHGELSCLAPRSSPVRRNIFPLGRAPGTVRSERSKIDIKSGVGSRSDGYGPLGECSGSERQLRMPWPEADLWVESGPTWGF